MTLNEIFKNKIFWVIVVSAVVFAIGFYFGRKQEPQVKTVVQTVEDTETRERLQELIKVEQYLRQELKYANQKISELSITKTEKVRIIYRNDGTTVVEKDTTTDVKRNEETVSSGDQNTESGGSTVAEVEHEVEDKTHREETIDTTPMPKDDFYLGISTKVGISGISSPGVEFKYRLFDLGKSSIWVGSDLLTGDSMSIMEMQLRIGVGVSF